MNMYKWKLMSAVSNLIKFGIIACIVTIIGVSISLYSDYKELKENEKVIDGLLTISNREDLDRFIETEMFSGNQKALVEVTNGEDFYMKKQGTSEVDSEGKGIDEKVYYLFGLRLGINYTLGNADYALGDTDNYESDYIDFPLWLVINKEYDNASNQILIGNNLNSNNELYPNTVYNIGNFYDEIDTNSIEYKKVLKSDFVKVSTELLMIAIVLFIINKYLVSKGKKENIEL